MLYKMYKLLLCVISCYVIGSQSAAAPFIVPCKIGDNACLLKSMQEAIPHVSAGIPSLGVHSMDPLVIDEINGDNGELKLQFKDMTVTGLSQCKVISASFPDRRDLEFVMECPIDVVGKYTLGGKLTVVPIEGEGNFEIKSDKFKVNAKAQLKEEAGFVVLETFDYTYDPVERFYFTFENLFNGDQQKAKPVLDILNESWKAVILDVGKPVIGEIVDRIKSNIISFFGAVPSVELYVA